MLSQYLNKNCKSDQKRDTALECRFRKNRRVFDIFRKWNVRPQQYGRSARKDIFMIEKSAREDRTREHSVSQRMSWTEKNVAFLNLQMS